MTKSLATQQSPYTVSDETAVRLGSWRVVTLAPGAAWSKPTVFPRQIHGGNIVDTHELARGQMSADGVMVKRGGEAGGVRTADCAPVVIVSDEVAAVLHISRKTIVRGLVANVTTYIAPREINHIFIGPHICEYHFSFEEEDELLRQLRYRCPAAVHFHKGKMYLSLRKALKGVFDEWQIHPDKITEDGRCNYEQLHMPSYRRWCEEGKEGKLPSLKTVVWCEV